MKFEIEKVKDGTFTTRIRVNGKVTFSNNGLNTKQAAYKKIIGLYKGILDSLYISYNEIKKQRGEAIIFVNEDMPGGMHNELIEVKEINC